MLRLFLTLVTVTLASGPVTADGKLKVVASFSIIGDLAARVGGGRIEVATLVGPDGDVHVFEPKPADAGKVRLAKLMLVNGLGYEGWLERLIEASGSTAKVVTVSDGVATIRQDASDAVDPHAWQSVPNAVRYVGNITRALCDADKDGCAVYRGNAAAYTKELEALDLEIRKAIDTLPKDRRTVITSHDAFGYLGHEYGIAFLAPVGISVEAEASAAAVARLIDEIEASHASAIFVENVSDPRLIEEIGKDTGLEAGGVLYSDALSGLDEPAATYIGLMRHNVRTIVEALSARG